MDIVQTTTVPTKYNRKGHYLKRYGICITTFWKWGKENGFPKPVNLCGIQLYDEAETDKWELENFSTHEVKSKNLSSNRG